MFYLQLISLSVLAGVAVDSETLSLTDFVNLKIKLTQSFEGNHRGKICVCVFIKVDACIGMSICIVSKKIHFTSSNFKILMNKPQIAQ
jgi:hypothetical protein